MGWRKTKIHGMFISENIVLVAITLEYFAIQCSDLCSVWKSVSMSWHEEVILVISTTNGPNITFQKPKKRSKVLQVHFIAKEWGFFDFWKAVCSAIWNCALYSSCHVWKFCAFFFSKTFAAGEVIYLAEYVEEKKKEKKISWFSGENVFIYYYCSLYRLKRKKAEYPPFWQRLDMWVCAMLAAPVLLERAPLWLFESYSWLLGENTRTPYTET